MIKLDNWNWFDGWVSWKGHDYSTSEIVEYAKKCTPFKCPVEALDMTYTLQEGTMTLAEHASHYKRIKNAKLKYPIVLATDGFLLDGRYRIIKAALNGRGIVKVVRLTDMPQWFRESK